METDMNLWSLIVKGGWLMIPIFILSVIAIYIAVERWWQLRKLMENDTVFPEIEAKGASLSTPEAKCAAMEREASYRISLLERGFSTLATCAAVAPMLGFLGTVIGMVQAFYDMAVAGSNIDIALLSRGIYTAMITTVAGLIVGIISQLCYNYLVSLVGRLTQNWQHRIDQLNY